MVKDQQSYGFPVREGCRISAALSFREDSVSVRALPLWSVINRKCELPARPNVTCLYFSPVTNVSVCVCRAVTGFTQKTLRLKTQMKELEVEMKRKMKREERSSVLFNIWRMKWVDVSLIKHTLILMKTYISYHISVWMSDCRVFHTCWPCERVLDTHLM